jgi:hypothetical protein
MSRTLAAMTRKDVLPQLLMDKNAEKTGRVMKSTLQMKKMDIAALERAAAA